MLHLSRSGRRTEGKESRASCRRESAVIRRAEEEDPTVSWARWNVAKAVE